MYASLFHFTRIEKYFPRSLGLAIKTSSYERLTGLARTFVNCAPRRKTVSQSVSRMVTYQSLNQSII